MDLEMHYLNSSKNNKNNLGKSILNSKKASTTSTNVERNQRMAIRNRKQACLCRSCHIGDIHHGVYNGRKLALFAPIIIIISFDDRLITIESYIKSGTRKFLSKTLEAKGFTWINKSEEEHSSSVQDKDK
jgi:hypothetical protein